ncbi:uncharacterized protein LOC131624537 [Vicia villosa]|uniref:uncharacterized protein LOC131624537 n=1 Tax=Vicia villosa TaxID=3911 RepID=UPI00273C83AA|nr:uncharacterized protein LOC131624537 [Vicia villosa]
MKILVRKPFFLNFKKVPTTLRLLCDDITGSLVLTEPLNRLISLIRTKVDEALLNSMMQFDDPLLRCFTYRDFQLVPTLEEFSHIMDIPIPDQIPYTGEEGGPKLEDIAAALHLPRAEINKVWINRRDYSGIPVDFLYEKAKIFAKALSMDALESVLTLLIYGQVLVSKRQGCVLGCIPLLHKWFILHLPRSVIRNEEGLTWIQRIMKLSYDDIIWYPKEFKEIQLFDRCGEFPNVPLLGTRGGITCNPILARHQFGFALKDKPHSIYLSAEDFDYGSDTAGKKGLFIKAWSEVKKVGIRDLGRRSYIPSDLYFKWVYDRVVEFGIPYPSDTPMVPRITPPVASAVFEPYVPSPNEDLTAIVNQLKRERDDYKRRLQNVEAEKEALIADAKEKEVLLDYFSRKWKVEDFVSLDQINSWEQDISRLVQEREEMIKSHKEEVRVLKRKRRQEDKDPRI